MKIITIDPSMNGATAILVAKINPAEEEQITITDFAIVDFRATETTDSEFIKEIRYRQLEEVINFIIKERPYGVIMENFIMFRQQMGA